MMHCREPAQFRTAASPARPAMDEAWQRRTMAGALCCAIAIKNVQPAMIGRKPADQCCGHFVICRAQGRD